VTSVKALQRQVDIVRRLRCEGAVTVEKLATMLCVSHETIRRDLKDLATNGMIEEIEIIHGGARFKGRLEAPSVNGHAEPAALPTNPWETYGRLWAEMAGGERL
jgi:DeoR/GlpR family transcriptional regulator of sugar metabolism